MEAADKSATRPLDIPAISAPDDPDHSLNTIALPSLPEAAEGGETFLAAGIAPAVPDTDSGTSTTKAPPAPGAIDAEMRALSEALATEMREAKSREAGGDGAKTS